MTGRGVALIRDVVALAVDPSAATSSRVPFASQVRLGLGRDLVATLDRAEAPQDAAWTIRAASFRAGSGPFSALELLRHHAREAGSSVGRGGAFRVSLGPHPHCASPPMPAPTGLERLRRVSVQPAQGTHDGCLSWFTVDLFLDGQDRVVAVTLDVWEP